MKFILAVRSADCQNEKSHFVDVCGKLNAKMKFILAFWFILPDDKKRPNSILWRDDSHGSAGWLDGAGVFYWELSIKMYSSKKK